MAMEDIYDGNNIAEQSVSTSSIAMASIREKRFFFFLFRVFLKIFYSLELQVKHKINYGWEFRGQSREVEGDGVFIPTSGNISKSLL
jgi:hypothetical protein